MEKNKNIIIDTDILIKGFRGNALIKKNVDQLKGSISISIITALELYQGCNSEKRIILLKEQLDSYSILKINESISDLAFEIFNAYKPEYDVRPADSFIAATALFFDLELYTDNKKDYQFIKGLKFYHPK